MKALLMKIGSLLLILSFSLWMVSCSPANQPQKISETIPVPMAATPTDKVVIVIDQDFSYLYVSKQDMMKQADVIFLGKVTSISPTRWNQDSGEPWKNDPNDPNQGAATTIHTIEFEVQRKIIDTIGLGGNVTLTVLGDSPLDGEADHDLETGETVVVYARKTDLAWREGGKKPILEFIGEPRESYAVQGEDGLFYGRPDEAPVSLEQLLQQINELREIEVGP